MSLVIQYLFVTALMAIPPVKTGQQLYICSLATNFIHHKRQVDAAGVPRHRGGRARPPSSGSGTISGSGAACPAGIAAALGRPLAAAAEVGLRTRQATGRSHDPHTSLYFPGTRMEILYV